MKIANIRAEESVFGELEPIRGLTETKGKSSLGKGSRQIDPSRIADSLVSVRSEGTEISLDLRVLAEQFRLLRARVKSLTNDLKLRTILVTSALPGEGKTTVSANLAGSLSRVQGMRVLLIDLDLRHPTLHTMFGVETGQHKESTFVAGTRWQDVVYRFSDNLDVLFGFLPMEEPDSLLQGNRLEQLLTEAQAEYDIVVLDSAPMLAVADTHSLVPLVDCGIFVLNADTTPIAAAKDALAMLRDKIAGCVVNRVSRLKTEDYYRNSGYGYPYGYGSRRSEN